MAADFKRNRIAVILSVLILVLLLLATFGASATEETIDDSIACYYVDSLAEVEDATTLSENIILIEEGSPGEYSIFDYSGNAVYTDYGITVQKSTNSPSIDNNEPPSLYIAETDMSDENIQELIEDPSSSWKVGTDSNLELLDNSGNIILDLYPVSDAGYYSGKDLKINCNVSYESDYSAATLSLSLSSKAGNTIALNKLKFQYSFDGGKTWSKNNNYTITENSTIKIAIRDIAGRYFSDSVKVTGIASSIKIIHEDNNNYNPEDGKYLSAAIFQKSQEDGKYTLVAYAENSVFKNDNGYIVKSNQLYDNLSTELFLYFFDSNDPKKLTESDIVDLQPFEMTEGADITLNIGSKKIKVYTAIPEVEKETPELNLDSIKFEKNTGSSYDLSVKNGDQIRVSFSIKDENSIVDEVFVTFNNEKLAANKGDGDTYYCIFTIDDSGTGNTTIYENQPLHLTKIEYKDIAGNLTEYNESDESIGDAFLSDIVYYNSFSYDETIYDCNFKADKGDGTATAYAKDDDKVYVTFKTTHPISSIDGSFNMSNVIPISLTGESEGINEIDGDKYVHRIAFTVANDATFDQENITFRFYISDTAGNEIEISNTDTSESGFSWDSVTYYASFSYDETIYDCSFKADKADGNATAYAKDDDKVYVTFKTTHPISSIEGSFNMSNVIPISLTGESEGVNEIDGDKYIHSIAFTVANDAAFDQENIAFNFTISDTAGNKTEISNNDTTESGFSWDSVTYYAPIEISQLSFYSNNSAGRKDLIKNGENIYWDFKTQHTVYASLEIGDESVNLTETSPNNWSAVDSIDDGKINETSISDNKEIHYKLIVNDIAGNSLIYDSTSHGLTSDSVTYYAPISISSLTMKSNNSKTPEVVAKNGDIITVKFVSGHPVSLIDNKTEVDVIYPYIAGTAVGFSSENGTNWTGTYTVKSGDTADQAYINLGFSLTDAAGNETVDFTQEKVSEKVKYYAPLTVSNLEIKSNNANDGTKYAKDGDTIYLSFSSNHDLSLSQQIIASNSPDSVTKKTGVAIEKNWELKYKLKNGDVPDQEAIPFKFYAEDVAGNTYTGGGTSAKNTIVYYAPITNKTGIYSTQNNNEYVRNNGIVTISNESNHAVFTSSATICGRTATVSGTNSASLSLTYQIPLEEKSITEGIVTFDYILNDAAGNRLSVNKTNDKEYSKLIYDSTKPIVIISAQNISFSNKEITYNTTFEDTYLGELYLSSYKNGEQDQNLDSYAENETSVIKSITLDMDGNYEINAYAVDKAGNESEISTAKITVDMTNPEILAVDIDFSKTATYKEFIIQDHIEIAEDNLQEVICNVTDNDGSQDWEINEPITKDGKKSIYLLANDMAGNSSNSITFDIYIDASQPRPIVQEVLSNTILKNENNEFVEAMEISASLETMHFKGVNYPDKFTELYVLDNDGNIVVDLLKQLEPDENGTYTFIPEEFGEYTLVLSAADDIGNTTGLLKYKIKYSDKSPFQKLIENTPMFVCAMTLFSIGVVVSAVLIIRLIRNRKIAEEKAIIDRMKSR